VTFAITDAASDDVSSFTVEVTALELRKLGGAIVSVLTTPTTVDLAALTDASQILSAGSVPPGTYLSATITLDFTDSSCFLVGQSAAATILDEAGNTLSGSLTLPIDFGTGRLVCPLNRHKLLEFDFDLNQSVMTDTGANTVTVEPAFVMRVDPTNPKPLIAVGTLTSVDTVAGTFVGEIMTLDQTPISTATFHLDANAVYQIDGVPSAGSAGLTNLAAVPAGTWFQALCAIDPLSPDFHVVVLEAGTGTYNGGTDIVEGHIVDRTGATDPILTVLGHSNSADHQTFQFHAAFTVTTSDANTKVVRPGENQAYATNDLNVGQRVRIFGALTGLNLDATSATCVVREQPTVVLGIAAGAPVAPDLTIDLSRVDLRPETDFTWPSGGPTPPDPDAFTLNVGNLGSGLGIAASTPVAAGGYFAPFDDANQDFQAATLANLELVPSVMLVHNRLGGFDVDAAPSGGAITLTITGTAGVGEFAVIDKPLVDAEDLPTSPAPTIQPAPTGPKYFALRDRDTGSTHLYLSFADFSNALASQLGAGAEVVHLAAVGVYSSTSNAMAASLVFIVID